MSSTNHTTNYNLPQFVGSDKPAWLGDVNPAMNAIDTAMHANAVKAQQGVDDASTAQARADSAYQKAGDAETTAGTAQLTANQAVAGVSQNAGKITALENAFKMTTVTKVTNMQTGSFGNAYDLTLAQNSDGSVFKFYGQWIIDNNTTSTISAQKVAVAGLSGQYGFATGVYLATPPTEAYIIQGAGMRLQGTGSLSSFDIYGTYITVGTDGQIYIKVNGNQTEYLGGGNRRELHTFWACIYFNSNFGDEPTPSA